MSEDVKAVQAVNAIHDELDWLPVYGSGAHRAFKPLSSAISKAVDAVEALAARAEAAEAARDAALAREAATSRDYRAAAEALDDIREALGVPRGVFQSAADIARAARAALATPAPDALAAIRREAAERMRERAAVKCEDVSGDPLDRLGAMVAQIINLLSKEGFGHHHQVAARAVAQDRASAIRALPLEEGEG